MRDFYIHGRMADDSHPLLDFAEYGATERALYHRAPVPAALPPVRLQLGEPVPSAPKLVDYHSLPLPVISDRIRRVLEPLHLPDVQFIPAIVGTSERSHPYWLLHVWNFVRCIDRNASVLRIDEDDGEILGIGKLILDAKALDEIPPERRRLFRLDEFSSVHIWSDVVRNAVMATSPEGIRFWPANGWNESADFSSTREKSGRSE